MSIHRVVFLLLALALPAYSATLFVSPDGTGSDGLTWETAYPKIADAIAASSTDDEVWIRSGTYTENLVIEKPLSLVGGFKGNEGLDQRHLADPTMNPTVLDGNYKDSVINVESDLLLYGVTLTKGGEWPGSGGGIKARGIDKVLRLFLEKVEIKKNGRTPSGPIGEGGGLSLRTAICQITDSTFVGNTSSTSGGGIFARDTELTITRCSFRENISNRGGAITLASQRETCRIFQSSFERNDHTESSTSDQGDGSILSITGNAPLEMSNCFFSQNTDSNIYLNLDPGVRIAWTGCTFDVPEDSWAFVQRPRFGQSPPILVNSIIRGHDAALFPEDRTSPEIFPIVTYSNIEGGYEGEGNIDADPLWVDPENGDYRLRRGSPCIDSGTAVNLTIDFDGNPRPVGQFDMGAFEAQFLRSDLNDDGIVDDLDLMIFSRDWKKVSGG